MSYLQDHSFFLTLAYGVSGLLVLVEVLVLWQRCRRSCGVPAGEQP